MNLFLARFILALSPLLAFALIREMTRRRLAPDWPTDEDKALRLMCIGFLTFMPADGIIGSFGGVPLLVEAILLGISIIGLLATIVGMWKYDIWRKKMKIEKNRIGS